MPGDTQIGRPAAAPNYVGMYSEMVKGALEPMNYLLNYQKELSEEDLRKGQIQNFLDEHQDKANALRETVRSNQATESMTLLERQLEARRQTESERHNLIDEAHSKAEEGHWSRDDDLRAQTEAEVARHNKADEDRFQRDLDLRTEAQKSSIAEREANSAELNAHAKQLTTENENSVSDNDTLNEFSGWLGHQSPETLYDIDKHPEVLDMLRETRSKLLTTQGRARMDELTGPQTALGREVSERNEMDGFSKEAKDIFHDKMLKPDNPDDPTQAKFSSAMAAARQAERMARERNGGTVKDLDGNKMEFPGWSSEAQKAYNQARTDGKSPLEAQQVGRQAQQVFESGTKVRPEKPDAAMVKNLQAMILPTIKQREGESSQDFEARSAKESTMGALHMEELQRTNPQQFQEEVNKLGKPDAVSDVDSFANKLKNPPKPAVSPGVTPAPKLPSTGQENSSTSALPATGGTSQLVSTAGGGNLPVSNPGTPNYLAADDSSSLYAQMDRLFNSSYGSLPGEGETEEQPATTGVA